MHRTFGPLVQGLFLWGVMAKVGRPTRYSKALIKNICDQIKQGASIRSICKNEDMPDVSTVMNWLGDDNKTEFLEQYTRACKLRSLLQLDEIHDIVDDGSNDWMERNGHAVENREVTSRSKLRADARFRIHEIMYPKKYKGDDSDTLEPLPRVQVEIVHKSEQDADKPTDG